MTALTRDTLVGGIKSSLDAWLDTSHGDLVVGVDNGRILVFAPGGPFFAVTVEELSLTPKRAARKKATT